MIGKLRGRLDYRAADHVLIEAGGVGYIVYCSQRTLAALPPPGAELALYTDLVVREDLLQLIGFESPAEREWHRLLTSVQGVGARVSLSILGRLGAEGVARALATGDQTAIRAAQGVGPKLAARIVTELRDRAAEVMALDWRRAAPAVAPPAVAPPAVAPPADAPQAPAPASAAARGRARRGGTAPAPAPAPAPTADALSALLNLGYAPAEAAGAVAEAAAAAPGADLGTLVRAALRRLAPGA